MEVKVRHGNLEGGIAELKRRVARDGTLRRLRERAQHIKKGDRARFKHRREIIRRRRQAQRYKQWEKRKHQ